MRAATTPELSAISCSSASITGSIVDVCTIALNAAAATGGFNVSLSSNDASLKVPASVTVPANASSAKFNATATWVETAQTGTITAKAGNVSKTYGVKLNAETPTLKLSASSISFGSVIVNSSSSAQYLTLTSAGTAPLTINSATLSGTGLAVSLPKFPLTLNPGQTERLELQFRPTRAGNVSGELTINSTSLTNSKTVIGVTGIGTPELTGISCTSAAITGSVTDVCTVALNTAAAVGGFEVGLASSDSSFKIPTAVAVPANASSAKFTAIATWVETAQTATITAKAGNIIKTYGVRLNAETPALKLSLSSLAFGSVNVGSTAAPQYLTLTSSGTAPLTINSATLSGTGLALSESARLPVTLNPGQSEKFELSFRPTKAGAVNGEFTINNTSISDPKASIKVTATGTPELTGVSCAKNTIVGTTTDVCTVTLNTPAAIGGYSVSLASNDASVKVPGSVTVPANASSVNFTATATYVTTAQTATLTARGGAISKAYGLKLDAATPALNFSISSVAFGNVTINSPSTRSITLTSRGTEPLKISGETITGTGFTLSGNTGAITLNPGQTATLNIQFDPKVDGPANGQLIVSSSSMTNPKDVISLSGTGIAAAALNSLSCANAAVTGSATDICTVGLTASAPANGMSVNLSSSDSSVKVPASVLVPAGASTVKFNASATWVLAAQTATLTAKAGAVSKTYALKLDAATPALHLSATSAAFGNVAVSTTATPQTITLSSTGTAPVTVSGDTLTGTGFTVSGITLPITLNPGQTAAFAVQFRPTVSGAVSGQLTLKNTSSTSPSVAVNLSGTGVPELTGLTCSSSSLTGSGTDSCTVTLNAAASTGGMAIALSSADAAVKVPASVTVPANATSAGFSASVSSVTTTQAAMLTASAGGVSKTFSLALDASVPTLSISASSLSFGSVTVNTAATAQSVTLKSMGTVAVTVNSVTVAGTGFKMSGGTFPVTLNPGQSTAINVQFDPTTVGAATGQLTISSSSSTNPSAAVSLSGTGTAVSGTLSALSCTSASVTGSVSDACTVSLNGPAPSGGVTVALSSSSSAVVVPASVTVPANASSAAFTATVSAVTSTQAATLSASAGGVSTSFALQLTATVPTLSVSATSLSFGSVTVNTAATAQSVTLKSAGTGSVTVNSVSETGSAFKISGGTFPITLSPGQSTVISVVFDPTAVGAATGQLAISSSSSTNPSAVVSLSGTGTAVAGTLSALTCTSGSVTGAVSDACTVSLNGPAASGGLTVALTSSSSAVVLPASVTVPANASSAGFTATVSAVTSTQTATLSASAGGVSTSFALQLTAGVPKLSVSSTSISFGNVTVSSPSTQSVVLSSTGTAAVTVNSATLSGTGFTMSGGSFPATLNPGQSVTLSIQFDPTSAGAATGQLSISSTASSVVVSLSGTGIAQSTSVSLSWNAPSSSPVPITGYNIYRALSGSSSYQLLNSSPDAQTSYTDTTVVGGQTYDYYVESVDSAGATSGPSNTYPVTVP